MKVETNEEIIKKAGFPVVRFTDFHFRVDGRLDIYTNSKGFRDWRYRSIHGEDRGRVEPHRVADFIQDWLRRHPKPEVPIAREYQMAVSLSNVTRPFGAPVTLKEKIA